MIEFSPPKWVVFVVSGVLLIIGLFFLSKDNDTELNCISKNPYKQNLATPLYRWFLTVYSNSLEYVADKHLEGENYETAIKLLTRVSYIQMRLNGTKSDEFIQLFDKIKTTLNKEGEVFLLKDTRLWNSFIDCDGLVKSLRKNNLSNVMGSKIDQHPMYFQHKAF